MERKTYFVRKRTLCNGQSFFAVVWKSTKDGSYTEVKGAHALAERAAFAMAEKLEGEQLKSEEYL